MLNKWNTNKEEMVTIAGLKWSNEEKELLKNHKDLSNKEISDILKSSGSIRSPVSIRTMRCELGIKQTVKNYAIPKKDVNLILLKEYATRGLAGEAIGDLMGFSGQYIRNKCKEHNIILLKDTKVINLFIRRKSLRLSGLSIKELAEVENTTYSGMIKYVDVHKLTDWDMEKMLIEK